jgi:hypothetical protein
VGHRPDSMGPHAGAISPPPARDDFHSGRLDCHADISCERIGFAGNRLPKRQFPILSVNMDGAQQFVDMLNVHADGLQATLCQKKSTPLLTDLMTLMSKRWLWRKFPPNPLRTMKIIILTNQLIIFNGNGIQQLDAIKCNI